MKRTLLSLLLACAFFGCLSAATPICGSHRVDAATMTRFVQRHNPAFDPAIAEAFVEMGTRYGIRGDVALCQAILETGWFKYEGGTAVTPEMHNYCGLGVTRLGVKGCEFETVEQGVAAMLQHLYAYCCTDPLPEGEELLDPRFTLVNRGCAPNWEELSGRWAMNPAYGDNILRIYSNLLRMLPPEEQSEPELDDMLY